MARRKPPKLQPNAPIYAICRKSEEDDRKQILSLEDQEALNTEHYMSRFPPEIRAKHRLIVLKTARSGFVPGLPTIDEVCKQAAKGNVYGVLATAVNRTGRNHTDLGRFVQDVADGFIPFFETTDGRRYMRENAGDIFVLAMQGVVGWQESENKSKVVFERMQRRAKQGKHMGRKMFGFKPHHVVLENGEVLRNTVADEERLPHLLDIFRRGRRGETYTEIELAKKKVLQRNGSPLEKTTIAGILKNPYYKGATKYDGVVYEGTHEAIVPPPLWNAAQNAIAGRRRTSGRKKKLELRRLFIFGATIKCAKCGKTMSPYRRVKKSGIQYIFYECKNRKIKCHQLVRQEVLKSQFDSIFDKVDCPESLLIEVRNKLLDLHKEKSAARRGEIEHLQEQYLAVDAELTQHVISLAKAKELGVEDIAEKQIRFLRDKRESIKQKQDALHDEGTGWIDKVIGNFKLIELAREAIMYGSPKVRESMIKALCSTLTVNDGKLHVEPRSPFKEVLQKEGNDLWWSLGDSNSWPLPCHGSALPAELKPQIRR